MRNDIRPILSALLRSRAGALLVAVQVAITLALVVNATYITMQRIAIIREPTGMDVPNIFVVSTAGFTSRFHFHGSVNEDLAYLRSLSGVVAAAFMTPVPLTDSGNGLFLFSKPQNKGTVKLTQIIDTDEQGLEALGLHLVEGRPFVRNDVAATSATQPFAIPPEMIVTRAWAKIMFPHGGALGGTIYSPTDAPGRIIGIVDHLQDVPGNDLSEMVALVPMIPSTVYGASYFYVVRTAPGRRDELMKLVEAHLASSNRERVIDWVKPLTYFKSRNDAANRALAVCLATITALLLAVSALGAFGLASYNVSSRTKQIGVRRALGGRRRDLVRYFMVENGLITGAGILFGSALALGVGYWLAVEEALPPLDLYYLIGGVLALYALGQLAAWYPARTAAKVPPAVATRTV